MIVALCTILGAVATDRPRIVAFGPSCTTGLTGRCSLGSSSCLQMSGNAWVKKSIGSLEITYYCLEQLSSLSCFSLHIGCLTLRAATMSGSAFGEYPSSSSNTLIISLMGTRWSSMIPRRCSCLARYSRRCTPIKDAARGP